MPEHQLDGADVDAVGEEPARALVTQIVPVQVDLPELLPVPWPPFVARVNPTPSVAR